MPEPATREMACCAIQCTPAAAATPHLADMSTTTMLLADLANTLLKKCRHKALHTLPLS
jgi:hypothetical protein